MSSTPSVNLQRRVMMDSLLGQPLGKELLASLVSLISGEPEIVTGNTTLEASDSGKSFLATAAADFTLPTIAKGLNFKVSMLADANLGVASPGSIDNIIHKGDAGADLVRCSTASQKIGSCLYVYALDTDGAGALKWHVLNLGGTTVTVT